MIEQDLENLPTENGYIKLHRSLLKKGFCQDSEYVHLWVYLLLRASYCQKEFLFNGQLIKLLPGQFLAGRNKISAETGISSSKVQRILKCLEIEHQIEQQMTNKFRIITICNWSKYQNTEQLNEPQVNSKWTASEQQVNTINNNKNIKKDNICVTKGSGFKKPVLDEIASYCLERQNKVNPQVFLDYYTSNGWRVGKNPMKDWRAAIRTWERNNFNGGSNGNKRNYTRGAGAELPADIEQSLDAATRKWHEANKKSAPGKTE